MNGKSDRPIKSNLTPEEALRRALNTPPPKKVKPEKKRKRKGGK